MELFLELLQSFEILIETSLGAVGLAIGWMQLRDGRDKKFRELDSENDQLRIENRRMREKIHRLEVRRDLVIEVPREREHADH